MIMLNGREYKLLLVDTNILIEAVRNPTREFANLIKLSTGGKYIICLTLFSLLEIKKSPKLYQQFLELFSNFPCAILKSHEQLLSDEVANYLSQKKINPILVAAPGRLASSNSIKDILELAFKNHQIASDAEKWIASRESVVSGIESLVPNFTSEGVKYSKKNIRNFVQLAGFQQIGIRQFNFAQSVINSGKAVEIDQFPSIKLTTLVVFYKFYVDKRKSRISDAFDILIFSVLPYVDAIITENHFVDMLKKIKSQDNFVDHVETYTITQLREIP